MARIVKKEVVGFRTVVELEVEGGIYLSANGMIHHNCDECKRLHLLENGITPRAWRLSECGHEYHKKGDSNPKISGLHPNERCIIATLLPGWGFNASGSVTYVEPEYDEYERQQRLDK